MVDFNAQVPSTSDPDYVRQASAGKAPPNQTLGTLFAGVGNLLDDGAKVADQAIQNHIKSDVYDNVDRLRDAQGVAVASAAAAIGDPLGLNKATDKNFAAQSPSTTSPGNTGNPPPQASVDGFQNSIQKLHDAYTQGAIGDTPYFSQLDALSRQIRSRYPGYRDQVDQMIQTVTGITPANALRKSLETDLQASTVAQGSAQKEWDGFVKEAIFKGVTPPDYFSNPDKYAGPLGQAQFKHYVATQTADAANTEHQKAKISLAAEQGNLDQKTAVGAATADVNRVVDQAIANGSQFTNLEQVLAKHALTPSQPWSPEETAQISTQLQQLKYNLSAGIDQKMKASLGPGTNSSYESLIADSGKVDGIKKQALARVDSRQEMITNKDFGALTANANLAKGMMDSAAARILQSDGTFQKLDWIHKNLGDQALSSMLTGGTKGLLSMDDTQKAFNTMNKIDLLSPNGSITRAVKTLSDNKAKPEEYRQLVNDAVSMLTNSKMPIQGRIQAAQSIFNPKEYNLTAEFDAKSKLQLFTQMASPAVTKAMAELKQTNPEVWDQYAAWTKNKFVDNLTQSALDLGSTMQAHTGWSFKYDSGSNSFSAIRGSAPRGTGVIDQSPGMETALNTRLDPINRALQTIAPVLKADGRDVQKEMFDLLSGDLGINVPGLQRSLRDAVQGDTPQATPGSSPQPKSTPSATPGKHSALTPPQGSLAAYASRVQSQEQGTASDAIASTFPSVSHEDDRAATQFLTERSTHGPAAITGMQPVLRTRLSQMIQDAPPEIQKGLGVFSGYRSRSQQEALFANSDGSGRLVAHPGRSEHEAGLAADLSYNGVTLKHAPQEVIDWVHQHASQYGLKFPMRYENWHVEPMETRDGKTVD